MLGTSTAERILIRFCITFFRYTPLLYIGALAGLFIVKGPRVWQLIAAKILLGLLAIELAYYTTIWRSFQARLRVDAVHPPPLSTAERRQLFDKCFGNVPNLESYLRWWFLGAEIQDIRQDNLKEFLQWAFFDHNGEGFYPDGSSTSMEEELDEYIAKVELGLGRPLQQGRGPAESLRLTFDKIETTYRCLFWYLIIFLVDSVTHLALWQHGFQYFASSRRGTTFPPRPLTLLANKTSKAPSLSYWYQPHEAKDGSLPVLFFHGIGVGLWTYVRFMSDIQKARRQRVNGTGFIAIEILPISFRLTAPPLDKAQFIAELTDILNCHEWDQFALVSHSYGSVLTTYMLRDQGMQQRVRSVILIDPVTLMLHLPDVAYNFTRRRPKRANEWQLWYFASTDPGVAHCLGRHFFWRDKIIWKEELMAYHDQSAVRGRRRTVVVFLSGRDLIVDTATVAQYLAGSEDAGKPARDTVEQIKVVFFPSLDHAQVFDDAQSRDNVVSLIGSCCAP